MRENPWIVTQRARHGKAVIHVGLRSEAAHLVYARRVLEGLVQKIAFAGSLVSQVGIWKGAAEPSAHLEIVNGGDWARRRQDRTGHGYHQPWPTFKAMVEQIAQRLARSFAQKEVLVEYTLPGGGYLAKAFRYTTAGKVGPHSEQRIVRKLRALARRVRRGTRH